MRIFGINFGKSNLEVTRDRDGNWSYLMPVSPNFTDNSKYLEWSLENPVLFAVCLAKAKLYSQMRITAVDKEGKEVTVPELDLLSKPNYFQSQQDFLFQQSWILSSTGNNLVYQLRPYTNELPKALYNLVQSDVDYKETMKIKKFISSVGDIKEYEKQTITYKLDNQEYNLLLRDLIPLYDVTNGLKSNNIMMSPSRVASVAKNLLNIEENMKAENVNLQMSQKFMARNKNNFQGVAGQLHEDDRKSIENVLMSESLQITNGDIEVQHLVQNLKQLYLSEQFAHDATVIANAFEMNKDVINYALTGSTFENQEHGIIRFIQTAIQSDADNTMNSFTNSWGLDLKGIKLKASYNHLPIMQTLMKSRIDTFNTYQDGLKVALENQTISIDEAKEMTVKMRKELGL